MPELAFVIADGGNWFFDELVIAIREELDRQRIRSVVSAGEFPKPRSDRVNVLVAPHEYSLIHGDAAMPVDEVLARTIVLSTEQPGSIFFDLGVAASRLAGITFDLNAWGVDRLRAAGIDARLFQLGYTPSWDRFDEVRERDIDILFLAGSSRRRLSHLASYGGILSRWNCHIRISDSSAPNSERSSSFLTEGKWELLARAKLLLNIHADERPYFEWLRASQAMCAGAVVVSEHSSSLAPLEPGTHLCVARPESLGLVADALLRDPGRRERIRHSAYRLLQGSHPLARSVAELVGAARTLVTRPLPADPGSGRSPRPVAAVGLAERLPQPRPPDPVITAVRRGVAGAHLDLIDLRRWLARLQRAIDGRDGNTPEIVRVHASTAWTGLRTPTVSVLIALYNHAEFITNALDSLARSRLRNYEAVVVDDGSTDGSGEAAREWLEGHDEIAAILVRQELNRGLGAARNTALDFARGRYCFILDADNEVYPRCLDRVTSALDEAPHATFAYPIHQVFGDIASYYTAGGEALVSYLGWEPLRLRGGNYIDAMAMIRCGALRRLGGYTTDRRLHGWEDFDLWCRIAEDGGVGLQIPQILTRYCASVGSLRAITQISRAIPFAAVMERSPKLMAGATLPP